MKAARWHGRGDVRVENVPQPAPGPGELLLYVSWCGICGTDLEEYLAGPALIPVDVPNSLTGRVAPLTLGHEFVGSVAAVGEGVTNFHVGERVAPEVVLFCGQCFFCRRHEYVLCVNWAAIGLMADGGLAEYAVVPAFSCAQLQQACGGVGPDVVFECAGATESADLAVRVARKGGRIVLIGIHPGRVPMSTLEVIVGEKRLVGSVQHHFDEDLPTAVRLLAEGKVQVRPLITAREPLERVDAGGFQALVEQPEKHLKILIGPHL